MEGITDLCIVGLDDRRPPVIRREPYIDLFFVLNHKAPPAWCTQFNDLVSKNEYKPTIKPEEGLYIDAWVRVPKEIPALLAHLKEQVVICSRKYVEAIEEARRAAMGTRPSDERISPEQAELNRVLAELDFDPAP